MLYELNFDISAPPVLYERLHIELLLWKFYF
jgi:hypothetical protein